MTAEASTSPVLSVLTKLIDRLDTGAALESEIIPWSCPVPAFGDLASSQLATVGINPSYREFVDQSGVQLQGTLRRFHTLQSLGLKTWAEADARHLDLILDSFRQYFFCNPYDTWFRPLEAVIGGANASYYDYSNTACHLDLIPFATTRRWTELSGVQHAKLRTLSEDTLGTMLRDSRIALLVLNGNSVVRQFEVITDTRLHAEEIPAWALQKQSSRAVKGIAYTGNVSMMCGVKLDRPVKVFGFNHNLQSSCGVTTDVIASIKDKLTQVVEDAGW